jgi:hypothetical protein
VWFWASNSDHLEIEISSVLENQSAKADGRWQWHIEKKSFDLAIFGKIP